MISLAQMLTIAAAVLHGLCSFTSTCIYLLIFPNRSETRVDKNAKLVVLYVNLALVA